MSGVSGSRLNFFLVILMFSSLFICCLYWHFRRDPLTTVTMLRAAMTNFQEKCKPEQYVKVESIATILGLAAYIAGYAVRILCFYFESLDKTSLHNTCYSYVNCSRLHLHLKVLKFVLFVSLKPLELAHQTMIIDQNRCVVTMYTILVSFQLGSLFLSSC